MGNLTQLHQGSLNGLRRQTNECIDSAYNKGYEDGKKEPREVKAVNVEDTNEYQIGYKTGYDKGFEDGKADATYNTDLIDELKQVEYIRGLEDVWKLARKIEMLTCGEIRDIFGEKALTQFDDEEPSVFAIINQFSYQESESMIKAYEEKKKAEEIKVGDVVKFNEKCHNYDHVKSREFLVLHVFDNGLVTLLYDNGDTGASEISLLDKTGRHFDEVEQLLDKMKE